MASKFWPAFIPEKANCIIQIPSSLIVKQVDLFCIGELSFPSFKRFFLFWEGEQVCIEQYSKVSYPDNKYYQSLQDYSIV